MKTKIDATVAATARCPDGKRKLDIWDTHIRGLVLEVRSTGGKTFYLRYVDQHDRQRQHKICAYGDLTIDKVRKEASRLRSEVTLGNDPAAEKENRKAVPTYAELAAQHLAHAKASQRSFTTTEGYMRVHIVSKWGRYRITEIRQQDVAQWLAEKKTAGFAPATVEKMRVIMHRSFELASQWGVPGSEKNPLKGIPHPPINNARERFLSTEEAERLRAAVAASRNTQLKFIVGLLLLTGARVSELLKAQWRHVDLGRRSWLIPTSKTGKSRWVPLSQPAIDLIGNLPRFDRCPYLIPNPDTRKPFVSIKHGWDKARRDAGLPDVRIHDLRHSSASFMINAGINLYAVGKVLGHANHKTTERYAHLSNDTLMAAVEAGAAKLKVDWAQANDS